MRTFVFTTIEFGKVEIARAANGNVQLLFPDSNIINDCIIDEKRNMHASFVYDNLKDDEVLVEWLDCYSNALCSTHKLDDIFNLDTIQGELLRGYNGVLEQGFGVDCWSDMYND